MLLYLSVIYLSFCTLHVVRKTSEGQTLAEGCVFSLIKLNGIRLCLNEPELARFEPIGNLEVESDSKKQKCVSLFMFSHGFSFLGGILLSTFSSET